MKIVATVVSTSLMLMSAASFAQSQPMTPVKTTTTTTTQDVATSESNKAGKMTAESQKAASDHYTKLDSNKDGKLSMSEFNATPKTGKDFAALDSDKDGSLTVMEFSRNQMQ